MIRWVVGFACFLQQVSTTAWFKEKFLTPPLKCDVIPPGHNLPFGYHKQPLPTLDIIPNEISTEEFDTIYVKPDGYRAGVFRGLQSNSRATLHWDDAHINKHFGHYKVLTEVKKEHRQKYGKSLNNISKFLTEYNTTNQYIVTVLPDDMRKDVKMPAFLQCGTYSQNLLELNLWMASGGTASQIHYDADHNVHCLIAGSKSFFLMHKDQYHKLNMERLEYTGSNFCPDTNQNRVDMLKEPTVSDVDYHWTVLHPGDCVFIPSQYMHQVRSYGRSISVTILWDPTVNFTADSLADCTVDTTKSIADFNVAWGYKAGDIFYNVGYATPYIQRGELVILWEHWQEHVLESHDDQLTGWTYDEFIELMFGQVRWSIPRCEYTETWTALIAYGMDSNHDGSISVDEISSSTDDVMRAVSHFLDAPNLDDELYNFCRQKFYYIPPEVVSAQDLEEIETVRSVVKWLELKGYKPTSVLSSLIDSFLDLLVDD